jgi:NAD(P)-dependent dehydrogenase (short-subunit alcohol dehydrogenase family)
VQLAIFRDFRPSLASKYKDQTLWGNSMEGFASTVPMGRPDEIATAALFLASSDSSFVTGIGLFVDGGTI